MSLTQYQHQLQLPPAVSLPREHLAAIQHIINDALALQVRAIVRQQRPPPPYNAQRSDAQCFKPRMDMYESPSGSGERPLVTATFELPGLRKEDVCIEVVCDHLGDHMVVSGDRCQFQASRDEMKHVRSKDDDMNNEDEEAGKGADDQAATRDGGVGYTVREIKRGRFRRSVPLPAGTKLEDVKASMHDGILTVMFPGAARPVSRSVPVA